MILRAWSKKTFSFNFHKGLRFQLVWIPSGKLTASSGSISGRKLLISTISIRLTRKRRYMNLISFSKSSMRMGQTIWRCQRFTICLAMLELIFQSKKLRIYSFEPLISRPKTTQVIPNFDSNLLRAWSINLHLQTMTPSKSHLIRRKSWANRRPSTLKTSKPLC